MLRFGRDRVKKAKGRSGEHGVSQEGDGEMEPHMISCLHLMILFWCIQHYLQGFFQ